MPPLLRVEFHELESWNNILASTRFPMAIDGIIKKLRNRAKEKAVYAARQAGWPVSEWKETTMSDKGKTRIIQHVKITSPLDVQTEVVLRFWRPDNRRYDVFSPCVKAVVDGFTDAGVFHDDNTVWVPATATVFEGVDASLRLSKEAKDIRKAAARGRKKSGLTPARYWFDIIPYIPRNDLD